MTYRTTAYCGQTLWFWVLAAGFLLAGSAAFLNGQSVVFLLAVVAWAFILGLSGMRYTLRGDVITLHGMLGPLTPWRRRLRLRAPLQVTGRQRFAGPLELSWLPYRKDGRWRIYAPGPRHDCIFEAHWGRFLLTLGVPNADAFVAALHAAGIEVRDER